MMSQENQIGKKPEEDLKPSYPQGKTESTMKELKFTQQRLRTLTSCCYLEQETYYHDHITVSSPPITSFLDSQQIQVLPLMYL